MIFIFFHGPVKDYCFVFSFGRFVWDVSVMRSVGSLYLMLSKCLVGDSRMVAGCPKLLKHYFKLIWFSLFHTSVPLNQEALLFHPVLKSWILRELNLCLSMSYAGFYIQWWFYPSIAALDTLLLPLQSMQELTRNWNPHSTWHFRISSHLFSPPKQNGKKLKIWTVSKSFQISPNSLGLLFGLLRILGNCAAQEPETWEWCSRLPIKWTSEEDATAGSVSAICAQFLKSYRYLLYKDLGLGYLPACRSLLVALTWVPWLWRGMQFQTSLYV